jgi:hypothetical protein
VGAIVGASRGQSWTRLEGLIAGVCLGIVAASLAVAASRTLALPGIPAILSPLVACGLAGLALAMASLAIVPFRGQEARS